MKNFASLDFDFALCKKELDDFMYLLQNNDELSERESILPFFNSHKYLSAFLGSYASGINSYNLYAYEYPIYGDFKCDLVVGDSDSKEYIFIEFEDAKSNSIFEKRTRTVTEWGFRFEHGYSQIIDWFWKLSDMSHTSDYEMKFGTRIPRYQGLLVIGRDQFLDKQDEFRLKWRRDKSKVDSKEIICLTYDELYNQLEKKISLYSALF